MSEKCEDRIDAELRREIENLEKLLKLAYRNPEAYDDNLGNLNEYGLDFSYIPPNTWEEQKEGYFRYQLSWGGPSDEFRFYVNPDFSVYRIEYVFLDWYDGAKRELHGKNYDLLEEIYNYMWNEAGLTKILFEEAIGVKYA